jgi:hypothetical protein
VKVGHLDDNHEREHDQTHHSHQRRNAQSGAAYPACLRLESCQPTVPCLCPFPQEYIELDVSAPRMVSACPDIPIGRAQTGVATIYLEHSA